MRFAVVMYGGTSLAIYINGVAQELLSLVRATAPETTADGEQVALIPTDELRGTDRVYRELGQLVTWQEIGDEKPREEAPIRTRFVVDILSGTSAGGLNAIYLGKALANEQDISRLKALWRDEADLALLVNDKDSTKGLELDLDSPQTSLLNSRRMYWQLLSALDEMDHAKEAADVSRLVDELDCWITATDIRGLLLPIDLFDRFVFERRHRKVFHFIYRPVDGSPGRNDFVRPINPFLAFAGRSTAAFPFAFESMQLADIDGVLKSQRFRDTYAESGSKSATWRRFFEEFLKPGEAETLADTTEDARRVEAYRTTSFGDGGYLDNKPFTYATGALALRRASIPVDRRLIYVEPDPNDRPPVGKAVPAWREQGPLADIIDASADRPNALANVQAALFVLPRVETIREDLERLLDRNRDIARVSDIASSVDIAVRDDYAPEPMPEPEAWRTMSAREWMAIRGVQYAAYYRLHVASMLDDLAKTVTRAGGFDENSDEETAIRCFLQAWANRRYPETGTGTESQNELLLRFSLDYRVRRIQFLQHGIDELLRFDDTAAARMLDAGAPPELIAEPSEWSRDVETALYGLKATLDRTLGDLRLARGRLWTRGENPLYEDLRELPISRDHLRQILSGATTQEESIERARVMLDEERLDAFDRVAGKVAEAYATAFADARAVVQQALETGESAPDTSGRARDAVGCACRAIRRDFERYDVYDSIIFPVQYGHLDEADRVEVIRISPADAPSIIDEAVETRRKLAGTGLSHFGGFLDARWRRNDMLWGRLDAAERIIGTILFGRSEKIRSLRAQLLKEAQLAIIAEEFEAADESELTGQLVEMALATRPGEQPQLQDADARARLEGVVSRLRTPEEILAFMKSGYEVDRRLELDTQLQTAGRAAVVTGRVLDGISENPQVRVLTKWLARTGRFFWGLVELASPRFPRTTGRYWFMLLFALGVLMILLGLVTGNDGATHVGWTLVLVLAGLVVTTWVLRDVFDRRRRDLAAEPRLETLPPPPPAWKRALSSRAAIVGTAVVATVVVLAAVEIVRHLEGDLEDLVHRLIDGLQNLIPFW